MQNFFPNPREEEQGYLSVRLALSRAWNGVPTIDVNSNGTINFASRKYTHSVNHLTDCSDEYLGNYRLIRLLGHGGFASVYLGEHRYLKRLAAIKVLHTLLNNEDKESFFSEARLLANLSHPHIVRVLEFAVAEQRFVGSGLFSKTEYIPYLVMDFAPGNSLRALYPAGSSLVPDVAIGYIKQIAAALQYAHDQGIIHRDVKPENCLLNAAQETMLSDFGLALLAPSPDLLSTQQMIGTLPYCAPEQLRGKPVFASDQYSLGVLAYEWLCGRRPFVGEDIEILMQHLSSPPPPLRQQNPAISPALEEVVLKALEKAPQQRYPTIQAFARALEHANQWKKQDFSPYAHAAIKPFTASLKQGSVYTGFLVPYSSVEHQGRSAQEEASEVKKISSSLVSKQHKTGKLFRIAGIVALMLSLFAVSYGIFLFKTSSTAQTSATTVKSYHVDLARSAVPSASSNYQGASWFINAVNDGQVNSRSTSMGWSSDGDLTENHIEWIQLTFDHKQRFSEIDLYPRNDIPNVGAGFPIDFIIDISNDGVNWTTIVTKMGDPLLTGVQRFTFPSQYAQYIRVTGTNLRPISHEKNAYRMQFAEIAVS